MTKISVPNNLDSEVFAFFLQFIARSELKSQN